VTEAPIANVKIILPEQASGKLAEAYGAVKGEDGEVENLYLAMSLTPDVIMPADAHYRALLHNADNPLEPWLAELISTYVAQLCGCEYAAANHGANVRMYLKDDERADMMLALLTQENAPDPEDPQIRAALAYTRKLSLKPAETSGDDIDALREAGFCDKGISYIIQLVAAFAYWARMINGLGTRLGERIGIENKLVT
jgi:uncharacterized peroxidase-related enzyme